MPAPEGDGANQRCNLLSAVSVRLLVADDNRDAAESLRELLKFVGYDVDVVYDGEAAVRLACERQFHAAVLDIGMPKLNGYEAARRIRAHAPTVRLVALTGWGTPRDRALAAEAGFDVHLTKPATFCDLERALASARA